MFKKKKNVLAFRQDDRFYYQRAVKLIDNMEYVRGIKMLNAAIHKKPKNVEYRKSLSNVLSDIGYYSKSIDEIIEIMVIDDKIDPKCYYMLGYNYFELGEFTKALSMFDRYLSLDPEGDLSDEVFFFLENIEDFTLDTGRDLKLFPNHLYSTKSDIINIDETRRSNDIEVWTEEQNIKALMAYSKKEYSEAIKICRNILNNVPRSNNVLCTLALALHKDGDTKQSVQIAKELTNVMTGEQDDMLKVSFVLCELGLDKDEKELLYKLKALLPYSEKINHYLAIAHYNCGEYSSARKLWNTCLEISSDSYKYKWYIENAQQSMIERLEYIDDLPQAVLPDNIYYLEKRILKSETTGKELCWSNEKFRRLAVGTFEKGSEKLQQKLIRTIFHHAAEEREGIFRKFLLNDGVGERSKNEILSLLNYMKAQEPFLMMANSQLVDVAISVVSVDNESKSDFVKALNFAINKMCKDKSEKEKVTALWSRAAVKFMTENKRIKKTALWGAAFYCVAMEDVYTAEELLAEAGGYGILKTSLQNVIRMIIEKKGEKHDY